MKDHSTLPLRPGKSLFTASRNPRTPVPRCWWRPLLLAALISLTTAAPHAQTCELSGTSGGESIAAQISIDAAGTSVGSEAVVIAGTTLRLDAIATAYGECHHRVTGTCGSCACSVDHVYNRVVHHITVTSDRTTATSSGSFLEGYVYGKKPDGTTGYFNVLDTHANSTGPIFETVSTPGTYRFNFYAVIDDTICDLGPATTQVASITIHVREKDDDPNSGTTSCNQNVGGPVNVTNGNMYLQQTDYRLPGVGEGVQVTRTYNSNSKRTGLFGFGWASALDESITGYGAKSARLNLPDGRAIFFARGDTTSPLVPREPLDFRAQIVVAASGYTLIFADGRVHQFDPAGKLLSIADRNGNLTTLSNDASGRPLTITDSSGRTLSIAYTSGLISSISDPVGTIATYVYGSGRLSTVTYADGSQFKFTYFYNGFTGGGYKLTTVKDALNNVLESHAYDAQGRAYTSERQSGVERYTLNFISAAETDVTDALGRVTKYFFDKSKGRNVVTRVKGSCGCGGSRVETWAYDARLNVTARTNVLGQTTAYTYDTAGNRLTESGPLGTTTYTYNAFGQVLTVTDPLNGVSTYTYDGAGNVLTARDALDKTSAFTYTARGQLASVTDPRTNRTEFTYDSFGNLIERKDAGLNTTTFAYDTRGRLTAVTDALTHTTVYEYDLAGRVKKVTLPDNSFVTFTYDLAGRRTRMTDARGNSTDYEYDTAYRLKKVTDAAAKTVSYSYDLMSNVASMTDQLGRVTNYEYDESDRPVKMSYPEATVGAGRPFATIEYDAAGNVTKRTDTAGQATLFAYDSASRLMKVTDAALKDTLYEYDGRSRLTAVVDPLAQRYEFGYDAMGHLTQVRRGGLTMSFAYDAAGNRTRRTDYKGVVTDYTYDPLNRLTTVSYPNNTSVTYSYDVASHLTSATNQTGTVAIGYDSRDRVSGTTDVWGQAVGYGYDANDNRTAMSLGAVANTSYQYDTLNRLTQLTDSAGGVFTFTHDAAGRLTSRAAPNGVAATYSYDGLNRLTRLKHTKGITTVGDYQYQFNAGGGITQLTDGAVAHTYSYDAVDRLTAAAHPGQPSESYTYDAVGNRTASHLAASYQYQPFNKVVAVGSTSYAYDANGNLISRSDASGAWEYFWDYENQLVEVRKPDGTVITYKYDALGRRVETGRSDGTWTRYDYDGTNVILDRKSDGSVTEYANGLGVDEKLRQRTNGSNPLYFVVDHLGSTRALTDSSGNVVESMTYDSFGNGPASTLTRYGYTGRELDSETGLYYYRARWYDPAQGRFVSEDPIGLKGGINPYAYVGNKPLNSKDPTGLLADCNCACNQGSGVKFPPACVLPCAWAAAWGLQCGLCTLFHGGVACRDICAIAAIYGRLCASCLFGGWGGPGLPPGPDPGPPLPPGPKPPPRLPPAPEPDPGDPEVPIPSPSER